MSLQFITHLLKATFHKDEICDIVKMEETPKITSMEKEMLSTQYKHKCEICDKLKEHKCEHKCELCDKPEECEHKCELCNKLFPEEPDLVGHMLAFHGSEESEKEMNILRNIARSEWEKLCVYRDLVGKGVRYYACGICDAQFSEYRYLRRHELTLHYLPCTNCGKKFADKWSLKQHRALNHIDNENKHVEPRHCEIPLPKQHKVTNQNDTKAKVISTKETNPLEEQKILEKQLDGETVKTKPEITSAD